MKRKLSVTLLAGLITLLMSVMAQAQGRIFYYNESNHLAAVGEFDQNNDHVTLSSFYPGNYLWTSVISDGPNSMFYYDKRTGVAMLGNVDDAGNHTVVKYLQFGAGWTHIVSHRGYLFFYCAGNGMAAIGQLTPDGFRQYKGYPAYTFGLGWTTIVSTRNGLLFYRAGDGIYAVGDWEYSYYPCGGEGFCFPSVSEVRFKQMTWGYFTRGWSSIVETNDGVLFYRKTDGLHVMVDIDSNGRPADRQNSVKYLTPGYTGIVAAGDDILFYNAENGDGAVGGIIKPSPWVITRVWGTLEMRKEFPAAFSTGWSHLTTIVDPLPPLH